MKIWDKLLEVDVEDKEKYIEVFVDIIKQVKEDRFAFKIGDVDEGDYYIVVEENRMNSYFIHVVPKEVYDLFKEMQKEATDEFLGFSVIAGKFNGKDIRISCFGIPCNLAAKFMRF